MRIDDVDRLTNLVQQTVKAGPATNEIANLLYGYDDAGNRTWVKRAHNGGTGEVYRCDAADQVTNVIYNVVSPDSNPTGGTNNTRYVFDGAGNRTSVQVINGASTNTTAYGVNNLNQYTNVAAVVLRYDANGNLTNDATWALSYDAENRLTNAVSGGTTVSFVYDALGRLVERTVSGTVRRFYWAGWQLLEERNGNGDVQQKYVYGPGLDEPLRLVFNGKTYYHLSDGLGSITEVIRDDAVIFDRYRYDVYGTPTILDQNGNVVSSPPSGNRWLFTGRDYDPSTGLYNYRYRYYSPGLGRFVQVDPIRLAGADLNLYRYVWNNPLLWSDPRGLWGVWIGGAHIGNDHPWLVFGNPQLGEVVTPPEVIKAQGVLFAVSGLLLVPYTLTVGLPGLLALGNYSGAGALVFGEGVLIAGGGAQAISGDPFVTFSNAVMPTQLNFFVPCP